MVRVPLFTGLTSAVTAVRLLSDHHQVADVCALPKSLGAIYSNPRVVGSGATACVFLAEDATGTTVAIKVQKSDSSGSRAAWAKECETLQTIRKRACSLGSDVHSVVETFIPNCLDSGYDGVNYYVMHAAGTEAIEKKTRLPLESQLTLFAQMVGAMYGLHATGLSHNDLHGENIVMDEENHLAVIDFGELAPHHSGSGYKHDINSVWKWAAQLAVCPSNAFPSGGGFAAQRQNKKNFQQCMAKNWNVDPESLETIGQVLENAILKKKDQMLKELWETEFVQGLDTKLNHKFAWSEMEGCLEWDWNEIKGVEECTEVPSFYGQCPIESRPGACYNNIGGWSCWSDGVDFWKTQCQEQGYDGACSYRDHGKELKLEDLPTCTDLDVCEQQCATKPGMFGACYTSDTSIPQHLQCKCVKASNKWMIQKSLLKGGCQTTAIASVRKTYEGLCVYPSSYAVIAKKTTKPPAFDVFGVPIKTTTPVPTLAAGEHKYKVGDLILAQNAKGVWKQGTIHQLGVGKVQVHFDGFNKRFNKWVPELSDTIKKHDGSVPQKKQDAIPR